MGPVYTVLQLQLVMWLDVQQKMLVKTYTSDQMCTVSTLQRTTAVDVLQQEQKQTNTVRITAICRQSHIQDANLSLDQPVSSLFFD